MYECYENIIGLSQIDCDCTAENRPTDYNTSKSKLFLDELTPVDSLVSVGKCQNDIWSMLTRSLDLGIKKVVADSNGLLGKTLKLRRPALQDQVLGEIKANKVLAPTKNYSVTRVYCAPIRSGFLKLNKIGGVFQADGTVEVSIYDNVTGLLPGGPYVINTIANKHQTVDVNLELPLFSKYVPCLEYYLVYTFNPANYPKDTQVDCGCGNEPFSFNTAHPYFNNAARYKRIKWAKYLMVGSTEVNSLSELDDLDATSSNDMHGLTLDIDLGCKVHETICKDALDFDANPLAMSLAFAVQYATGVQVADQVLKSDILSRANMINRDDWEDAIEEWNTKYNEHINYIVANVDHTANDCFTCKDLMGYTRQGLFA